MSKDLARTNAIPQPEQAKLGSKPEPELSDQQAHQSPEISVTGPDQPTRPGRRPLFRS